MAITAEGRALVDAARDVARREPQLVALGALGRCASDEEVAAHLQEARREVERHYRTAVRERADAVDAVRRSEAEVGRAKEALADLKAVQDAVKAIDDWLVAANVRERVREGRDSLWNDKLERHLRAEITVDERVTKREIALRVDGALRRTLRDDLTTGNRKWIAYAVREVRRDLEMKVFETWMTREAELPVENPFADGGPLAGLTIAAPWEGGGKAWWEAPEIDGLEFEKPLPGFWALFGRSLRSLVFPVAMLIGVLMAAVPSLTGGGQAPQNPISVSAAIPGNVPPNGSAAAVAPAVPGSASLSGGQSGSSMRYLYAIFVVFPVAWWVAKRDRASRVEQLRNDGLKALQDRLVRWAEGRLDRTGNRIRDHLRYQLGAVVRRDFVEWYRGHVVPLREQHVARQRSAEEELDRARQVERQRGGPSRELERLRKLLAAGEPRVDRAPGL